MGSDSASKVPASAGRIPSRWVLGVALWVLSLFVTFRLSRKHPATAGLPPRLQLLSSPEKFCTADKDVYSVFYGKDEWVDLGHGKSICVDAILYGYDLLYERKALFSQSTWLGVLNQQDPTDAMTIQELLWHVKPDVVIELGTNTGGGAVFFASIMQQYSPLAKVITIDPRDIMKEGDWYKGSSRCRDGTLNCTQALDHPVWRDRVTFIQGIPTTPDVLSQVAQLLQQWGARTVMVSEDSSHLYNDVLSNSLAYAKFVTNGSYMIIQDTKMTRWEMNRRCGLLGTANPAAGCRDPKALAGHAAAEFTKRCGSSFVVDKSPEYLYYTQHANGFMKRVKDFAPGDVC